VSIARLRSAIGDLPYSFRDQIVGFATYVDDASDDLFDAVGIREPSREQVDQLVYAAGLWRMWQTINSLFSLLDNSLALLQPRTVGSDLTSESDIGYRMGGYLYSRNSRQYAMLTSLRSDLSTVLNDQGLSFIRTARNIPELVRGVVNQNGF
jgi:hypothetical protein